MAKALIAVVILAGLGAGVYFIGGTQAPAPVEVATTTPEAPPAAPAPTASTIEAGTYAVVPGESTIAWSAQKPLIEGYINSGTMPVASGTIEVLDPLMVSGLFTMNMDEISVGLTALKPGKESALEEHLKKADFFDVENYPTAEFRIKQVVPHADVATTFTYDLTGDLTLKGVTNEVVIPAVLQKEGDNMVARAEFEIDRTLWDIKIGSGKFFTELGDNMIGDMVALNLTIVAQPVPVTPPTDTEPTSAATTTE